MECNTLFQIKQMVFCFSQKRVMWQPHLEIEKRTILSNTKQLFSLKSTCKEGLTTRDEKIFLAVTM